MSMPRSHLPIANPIPFVKYWDLNLDAIPFDSQVFYKKLTNRLVSAAINKVPAEAADWPSLCFIFFTIVSIQRSCGEWWQDHTESKVMNMMLKGRFTSPRHIPSEFSASCQPVLRAQDLLLSRELSYQYTTGIFLIVKKRLILYKLGEQNVD